MTKTPLQYFMEGFNAADQGLPASACPLLFNAWPRQAWLEGHTFFSEYAMTNHFDTGEPLERVDITPEEQGYNAHAKGSSIADCPYDPDSQDWRNWRLGWHSADVAHDAQPVKGVLWGLLVTAVVVALVWALFTYW